MRSIVVNDEIKDYKAFYDEVINNDILLEAYVKQHHELAKFAPKSCNTIRIMTFAYDSKPYIMAAILRVGNGIADVDNFHQGGMGVKVDVDSGELFGNAIDKDNVEYERHPLTNYQFDGFAIPNWDIVKKTVLEAALVSDKIHFVG